MHYKPLLLTAGLSVACTLAAVLGVAKLGRFDRPALEASPASETAPVVLAILDPLDPEDLGLCVPDSVMRRRFRLTNIGSRPIGLEVKSKSCGCASVNFDKTTLLPNESTAAAMEIQTTSAAGALEITVVIEATTLSGEPRFQQDLKAVARYRSSKAFEVLPAYSVVREYAGQAFARTIHIHTGSCSPLVVTKALADADWIKVSPPEFTNKPTGGWVVQISGTIPPTRQSAKLSIETKCVGAKPAMIPILFDPVDPWSAMPAGVASRYEPKTSIEQTIVIESLVGATTTPSSIKIPENLSGILTAHVHTNSTPTGTFSVIVKILPAKNPISVSGELQVLDDKGRLIKTLLVGLYAPK